MFKKLFYRAAIVAILFLTPWLIAHAGPVPRVVVSILPLKLLVDPLLPAGSASVLIPPGASPHHFALKPSSMRALQSADLFIWIGPDLEAFLSPVVKGLPNRVTTLTLMPLQKSLLATRKHTDAENSKSEMDPHIWLDPDIAIAMTKQIAAQLILLNPEYSVEIENRQKKLAVEIMKADMANKIKLTHVKNQHFFVFHDAYQYLEKHYHLQQAEIINYQPEVPMSLARLHALQKMVNAENVNCVLADPQYVKSAKAIFKGSKHIKMAVLDHLCGNNDQSYAACLDDLTNKMKECLEY